MADGTAADGTATSADATDATAPNVTAADGDQDRPDGQGATGSTAEPPGASAAQPTAGAAGSSTGATAEAGMHQLGEYIRLQRQMADLSLRRMAELTHVSNAYLSQVERGLHQPSIRVLRAIAAALGVSADTLLVQGGVLDDAARAIADSEPTSGSAGTETAIRNDPTLAPEDREALIRIYRSLRRGAGEA